MNLPVAQELCVFESWNPSQDSCLLAEFEVVLETDNVIGVGAQVLLAQLYDRIRSLTGVRVAQADRLHRPEAQRVAPAACNLLNRQAALEVIQVFPIFGINRLR